MKRSRSTAGPLGIRAGTTAAPGALRQMHLAVVALALSVGLTACSPDPLRPEEGSEAPRRDLVRENLAYGFKDGLALTFDVFQPEMPSGTGVLFVMSAGWVSGKLETRQQLGFLSPLVQRGFTVFAVRHSASPRYTLPEMVSDLALALRNVGERSDEFGIDPGRLGVVGQSSGGHLALLLASSAARQGADANVRIKAVASIFGPTDLREWARPESPYQRAFPALRIDARTAEILSPVLHVTAEHPPTLFVHGDSDTIVPLSHSRELQTKLHDAGVPNRLLVIEGAGHSLGPAHREETVAAVAEFFGRHLLDDTGDAP